MIPSLLLFAALLAQDQAAPVEMTAAEKQFQEAMTNVTLTGFYTVGESPETHPDKYTIEKLAKLKDDMWKFDAHIQYGGRDYRASVNIPVKWAGETPVLSMAQYMIAGQGVFSARILIFNGMYAGMWGSKDHGGKMFGMIVKNLPPASPPPQEK